MGGGRADGPETTVTWHRPGGMSPRGSSSSPASEQEVYARALEIAHENGLVGKPQGYGAKRVPRSEYAGATGQGWDDGLDAMEVWMVVLVGRFDDGMGSIYPHVLMAMNLDGDPVGMDLYPDDRPVPFKANRTPPPQ